MTSESDKKALSLVTNQKLLQVAEGAAKRVSELSKVISELQKSAEENATLASSMLATIQNNTDKIEQVDSRTSNIEEIANCNKSDLADCMARLQRLESKSRLSKEIDDQDSKIRNILRRINPPEMKRASCFVALHGLPLPEGSLPDAELSATIVENISFALGKEITKYIYATKDDTFSNIAGWFCRPGGDGHIYNKSSPEFAKNSVIFATSSRIQAIHLESKIRSVLISSQSSRKGSDFEGLELGFFTDSPKVKALFKLLLYKGKILTGAVDQVSHYRVSWKGGAKRNDSSSTPYLALELKADKEYISRREEYFFKDGNQIRSIWTEDYNVMLSDLANIWFARKPDQVQLAEKRIQHLSDKTIDQISQSSDDLISEEKSTENPDKRKRDSPGLTGNKSKSAHMEGDNIIATITEEEEEEADLKEVTNTTEVITMKKTNEDNMNKPKAGRGAKTKNTKTTTLPKPILDFPPLVPKDNSQKKISALFSTTKKPPASDSTLPIPKIPA